MRTAPWRGVALAVLTAAACATSACGDDADDEPLDLGGNTDRPRVVEVVLPEPPVEGRQPRPFEPPRPTTRELTRHLEAVADRDVVKGVFLRLGPLGGGWGRATDLRELLQRIRDGGKPVHCHFELADNGSYALLASACDRLSMTPAGHLDLVGPAAHVFYARSLLEQIGLRAELIQIGRYKGAADPFTRDEMPPETREALGGILDDLHDALHAALTEGRGLSPEAAERIIDEGPYDAVRARELGLLDDVAFDDAAREHARRAGEVAKVRRVELVPQPEPVGLGDVLRALAGGEQERDGEGKRLALVWLEGTIVDAEREGLDGARSGPFVRALRRMADDEDVQAVVLRINSPGGSALASDRMWHAVRRVAKRKPVIASIGDMAASGGYYVASAATEIVAADTSLVGSIGVVGGKIQGGELAERVGVNPVVLERGDNAAWASPVRGFTDDEREALERMLRQTYARFVRRVAQGRDMERQDVLQAAEGRLMTGRRGRELGLVDEAGGLAEAMRRAREAGELPPDAPVELWPPQKSLLDLLTGRIGGEADGRARMWLRQLEGQLGSLAEAAALPMLLAGRERVAVTLPYVLHIQ